MDGHGEDGIAQSRLDALHRFRARVAPEPEPRATAVDVAAAEVLAGFEEAGVEALLLKGRGIATLLYGAGVRRSSVDVDLLVAPEHREAAENVLATLGYVEVADGWLDDVGRVVHARKWMRTGPRAAEQPPIDLHRWLPGARAEPAVVWKALAARRAWIELGGRRAAVLDRGGQAMHLATHAAQHGSASERHVAELAHALALWPAPVWESAARLAGEIGATDAFAAGLRLTRPGAAEAVRLGLSATDVMDWKIRHRAEQPRGAYHLQALAEARSLRARLDVLRRSLFPRRAWIVRQHPWAGRGWLRLTMAYGLHLTRAPVWATHAWRFSRRAHRSGRGP